MRLEYNGSKNEVVVRICSGLMDLNTLKEDVDEEDADEELSDEESEHDEDDLRDTTSLTT